MKRIFVAGHRGMVGSAICRQLKKQADVEIITRAREELDLCDQTAVHKFLKTNGRRNYYCGSKSGRIYANNKYPAEFIYQNLQIQNNVIHSAHLNDVRVLFLGSSCIYPRQAKQPISEDASTGMLESTNEPYAIAKIAGIKTCEGRNRQYGRDYRSVMPTNCMVPGITITLRIVMLFRHLSDGFIWQKKTNQPKYSFGGRERQGVNFFLWMIWQTLACLFITLMKQPIAKIHRQCCRILMLALERM